MKQRINARDSKLSAAALAILLAVVACNGGGSSNGAGGSGGGAVGGSGGGGTGGMGGMPAASFDRDIQKPIFNAFCIDCHHPTSAIGHDLTRPFDPKNGIIRRENSWVPNGSKETVIVDPGNVANSFLIKKVEAATLDDHVDGSVMPPQTAPLSQAEIDTIQKWITDGARNDAYFTNMVAPIFGTQISLVPSLSGKCTFCHYRDAPSGMNVLDVFDAAQGMVGRNSRYGGKIVAPGDPAGSSLMKKITGETLGARMPLRKPRLNAAQIDTLKKWIMAGAPNN